MPKTYVTEEDCRRWKRGLQLRLKYDDFNSGSFTFTFLKHDDSEGRLGADGICLYDDEGDDGMFVCQLYEYRGVMCRGSGAERVYVVGRPRIIPQADLDALREKCLAIENKRREAYQARVTAGVAP